jgi:farnesyl-diphosphate farnesyltransferase
LIINRELLRAVSRTFAMSIERLPGLLGDALGVAYLLLRISDFLEDNQAMPASRKVELLQLWSQVLNGEARVEDLTAQLADLNAADPEAQAAQQAGDLLAVMGRFPPEVQTTIIASVRATTEGMARWQARGPVVLHEADLDDYMHEVAGRVGYLVTDLFAWHAAGIRNRHDMLMPLAREFGLGLQTVNVLRGLRQDYERGWIYVPVSYSRAVDLAPQDLFDPDHRQAAMQVVAMVADKAERHLLMGREYIKAIPAWYHSIRVACIWPLLFAVRTLAVCRYNAQVLTGEAKISRAEIGRIVRDSTVWGWSNTWLDWYCKRLSTPGPLPPYAWLRANPAGTAGLFLA